MDRDFYARAAGNVLKGSLCGLAVGVVLWVAHVLRIDAQASPASSSMLLVILYGVLLGAALGLGTTRPRPRNGKLSLLLTTAASLMSAFFIPLILMGLFSFSTRPQALLIASGSATAALVLVLALVQFIHKRP